MFEIVLSLSFPYRPSKKSVILKSTLKTKASQRLPIRDWASALNQFTIRFEGRMPVD